MKYKASKLILFLDIIFLFLFVAADQVTKYMSVVYLRGKEPIVLLDNVLELLYLENKGAAFGILQNRQWFFFIVGVLFVAFAFVALAYIPTYKKYRWLRIALVMIAAGAVGNLIDRGILNYVVDFIYFKYINFPIFNVADCFVSVGTALLIILILFFYKDEELDFKKARIIKVHSSMLNENEENESTDE